MYGCTYNFSDRYMVAVFSLIINPNTLGVAIKDKGGQIVIRIVKYEEGVMGSCGHPATPSRAENYTKGPPLIYINYNML